MTAKSESNGPVFGPDNLGVEIIVVDETNSTTDTTRRPMSEAHRKALEKRLKWEQEWLREIENERRSQENSSDGTAGDKR